MVATAKPPRSNTNTLSAADREALREQLQAGRKAALELYQHDITVGKASPDEGTEDLVDRANKAYDQELLLMLSDTERTVVFQIDEAMVRFEAGTYGTCDHCGDEIGLPRLKAVPWARYCIGCQEREERGTLDL